MAWGQYSTLLRWLPVWRRNLLVWRKLAGPAIIGNIGEPLLYLLVLGYGLGALVGRIGEVDYVTFLASGLVCASAMNTASFEGTYSAYTRLAVQETWTAMLHTPLEIRDILFGEAMWGGFKSLISAAAILLVAGLLGAVHDLAAFWVLPVVFIVGFTFANMALAVTARSRSYDFFMYYFTLLMTPMLLVSGVFFPLEQLPGPVQAFAWTLPLSHAVALVRPLMTGAPLTGEILHISVLLGYAAVGFALASRWAGRRLHR